MDAIMWLIIGLVSAWLAYSVVAGERRGRAMAGMGAVGAFLAVFGAVMLGLGQVYSLFLRDKLVDDISSENTMLFVGLVVIAALVVLALDLLGTIDIMGQIQKSMNKTDTGRPNPGGPSGDD
ncbi:MAG: hypothetical protein M3439_01890 [Chloroflexota bacterium]|nr:hypothetical protein [Chloroflexota bacterium]